MIRHHLGCHRWEEVDVHPYKETGTHFRNITRQTLFPGAHDLQVELRYFEIGRGGHSTLERHEHSHLVTVTRGSGRVFVGDRVTDIGLHDVVHIPPMTWHQFRATNDDALGFYCIVSVERDRPQRPNDDDLVGFELFDGVSEFIRV